MHQVTLFHKLGHLRVSHLLIIPCFISSLQEDKLKPGILSNFHCHSQKWFPQESGIPWSFCVSSFSPSTATSWRCWELFIAWSMSQQPSFVWVLPQKMIEVSCWNWILLEKIGLCTMNLLGEGGAGGGIAAVVVSTAPRFPQQPWVPGFSQETQTGMGKLSFESWGGIKMGLK